MLKQKLLPLPPPLMLVISAVVAVLSFFLGLCLSAPAPDSSRISGAAIVSPAPGEWTLWWQGLAYRAKLSADWNYEATAEDGTGKRWYGSWSWCPKSRIFGVSEKAELPFTSDASWLLWTARLDRCGKAEQGEAGEGHRKDIKIHKPKAAAARIKAMPKKEEEK